MSALFDALVAIGLFAAFGAIAIVVVLGAVAMYCTAYTYFTGKELLP